MKVSSKGAIKDHKHWVTYSFSYMVLIVLVDSASI